MTSIFSFGLSFFLLGGILFLALVKMKLSISLVAGAVLLLNFCMRLWCRMAMKGLDMSYSLRVRRVFPGEAIDLTVRISNPKVLPVRAGIDVLIPGALSGASFHGETALGPFDLKERTISFTAGARGVYSLGPAELSAGDPFGLSKKIAAQKIPDEIVVYPRLASLRPLPLPFQEFFGIHPAKGFVEDPAWYAGTRDYTGLRPSNTIHWKASARLGRMQEKLFEPTSHRKVLVYFHNWGFQENGLQAVFEKLLEAAAALTALLSESGATFAFSTNAKIKGTVSSGYFGRGPEHLGRVLEYMARVVYEPPGPQGDGLLQNGPGPEIGVSGSHGLLFFSGSPPDETARIRILPAGVRKGALFVFGSEAPGRYGNCPAYSLEDLRED